jgi:hypothetical protein
MKTYAWEYRVATPIGEPENKLLTITFDPNRPAVIVWNNVPEK